MTARQKSLTAAAKRTVLALRRAGSLEACDELAIANVLFTAGQLDALDPLASPAMVASMCRAHLAACRALVGAEPAGDDNGLAEIVALMSAIPLADAPESNAIGGQT